MYDVSGLDSNLYLNLNSHLNPLTDAASLPLRPDSGMSFVVDWWRCDIPKCPDG